MFITCSVAFIQGEDKNDLVVTKMSFEDMLPSSIMTASPTGPNQNVSDSPSPLPNAQAIYLL